MSDPKNGSTEAFLSKASWVTFVIGGALIVYALTSESSDRERQNRAEYYRTEVEEGRLNVSPELKGLMDRNRRNYKARDYSGTMATGFLLILVGLGFSTYSNSIRKKRIGG
jgi:hypothetical protein